MNKKEAYQILVKAFNSLNKKQKGNLRYHLKKKTPIFCGENNPANWADGKGAG